MPSLRARTHVAWHDWLFRCLAATIILQLNAVEEEAEVEWDPTTMVVLVVCYLHRLVRPLAVLVVVEDAQPGG